MTSVDIWELFNIFNKEIGTNPYTVAINAGYNAGNLYHVLVRKENELEKQSEREGQDSGEATKAKVDEAPQDSEKPGDAVTAVASVSAADASSHPLLKPTRNKWWFKVLVTENWHLLLQVLQELVLLLMLLMVMKGRNPRLSLLVGIGLLNG